MNRMSRWGAAAAVALGAVALAATSGPAMAQMRDRTTGFHGSMRTGGWHGTAPRTGTWHGGWRTGWNRPGWRSGLWRGRPGWGWPGGVAVGFYGGYPYYGGYGYPYYDYPYDTYSDADNSCYDPYTGAYDEDYCSY